MGLPAKEVLAQARRRRKKRLQAPRPSWSRAATRARCGCLSVEAADPNPAQSASEIALIEKIGEELSVALEGISAITIRAQQMEFDPVLIEHFARIRASTETALAAIGDLVDFSNVSGGVVLHKTAFGLRAALADLVKRVASEAEERGCRLRVRVEQDVSDQLEGDVERLQMLLKNLLDNAFQLVPGAEITLHITPEYVTESGIQLSFGVSATQEDGEKPVPRFSPEAGMGVAVAKFMVTAMGGKLAVSSRPGGDDLRVHDRVPGAARRRPRRGARRYASLVGLSVLIVSADPEQRLGLSNTAARLAHGAARGRQRRRWRWRSSSACTRKAAPVPLVIVADQLPVQDGFLLAFRVKHHRSSAPRSS